MSNYFFDIRSAVSASVSIKIAEIPSDPYAIAIPTEYIIILTILNCRMQPNMKYVTIIAIATHEILTTKF
jgi:hypothetical protein